MGFVIYMFYIYNLGLYLVTDNMEEEDELFQDQDYSVTSFEWSDDDNDDKVTKSRLSESDTRKELFDKTGAVSACRGELFKFVSGLYKSAQYSDIVIHCHGGKLPGHRLVLSSQMLRMLLTSDTDIADIYLLDFDVTTVGTALQLLYNGSIMVNNKDAVSVKKVLNLLGLVNFDIVELREVKKKKERQKLKVKHEKNLGSRRAIQDKVPPARKKRVFMANLDPSELTCDMCNKSFPSLYKLKIHKLIHSETFPFMCMKCGKGFNNKYKMHSHEKKKLCEEATNSKPAKVPKDPIKVNINIYNCKFVDCPMSFSLVKDLKKHVQLSHKVKTELTCLHCSTVCRSQKTLITHLKVVHNDHESGLKCTCGICGKKFQKLSNLEDHILRHSEIKQFGCMYCPKRCATKQDLDRHLRSHSGEATFLCQFCSRTFVHRKTYTNHVRKHLGQKPYQCKPCNKSFAALTYLKKHQLSHQKKGDNTKIVTFKKGWRGTTTLSYIDHNTATAAEDPLQTAVTDSKVLDPSSSVYIPGPHYIQTGDTNVTPLGQMQVITDYTEVSRLTYDNVNKMSESDVNMFNKTSEQLSSCTINGVNVSNLYEAKENINNSNVTIAANSNAPNVMYINNAEDEEDLDDDFLVFRLFETQSSTTETTLEKL